MTTEAETLKAENHALFLKALDGSHLSVRRTHRYLECWGSTMADIAPTTRAPTADDWAEHSDGGDLWIHTASAGDLRVEVKHLKVDFTCWADWEYKPHFIVNSKTSHDRTLPAPYYYFILSHDMEHFARVFGSTQEHWYVEPRTERDRIKGARATRDYYFCPVRFIKFFDTLLPPGKEYDDR